MKHPLIIFMILAFRITMVSGQTALLQDFPSTPDSNKTGNTASRKAKYSENVQAFARLSFERGYIMPVDDKDNVNDLLKASSYSSVTIANTWDVSPNSVYSKIYRKPKLGIGMSFVNFHNQSFGKPTVLFGYTEIPINRKPGKLNFSYGIGAGIAWNFNHYDKVSNPGNEAIGSSVNAHLQANFNAYYHISEHFVLGLGTGFRHFSNGALQKPNAGINVIPLNISLQYKVMEKTVARYTNDLPPFQKHWSFSLYNSVGAKQLVKEQPTVFKNLLGFNAGYKFSYKYRAVAGLDFTYTEGGAERVPGDESNFSKSVSYGPYLGWEWFLTERLYIPIYCGIYLHRNVENEEEGVLFQRLGIRYCLLSSKALVIGTGLKSHLGSADFIEFTLGYNFRSQASVRRSH